MNIGNDKSGILTSHLFLIITHVLSRLPIAYITRPTTQLPAKPAPFMAAFSSLGPNTIIPDILKVFLITDASYIPFLKHFI